MLIVVGLMKERTELARSGAKGQIVVVQHFQKQLVIKPSTELCIYRKEEITLVKEFSPLANLDQTINKNTP